jgi:hypothetical protein
MLMAQGLHRISHSSTVSQGFFSSKAPYAGAHGVLGFL